MRRCGRRLLTHRNDKSKQVRGQGYGHAGRHRCANPASLPEHPSLPRRWHRGRDVQGSRCHPVRAPQYPTAGCVALPRTRWGHHHPKRGWACRRIPDQRERVKGSSATRRSWLADKSIFAGNTSKITRCSMRYRVSRAIAVCTLVSVRV